MLIIGSVGNALNTLRILFFLGGVVSTVSNTYAGDLNLLDRRPAIKSSKATASLLTDVTRISDKLIAVGERGHILISSNDGEDWTQSDVPVQLLLTAVTFPSLEQGWAVGHEGVILHTGDGGKSWQLQYANPYQKLSDDQLNELSDEAFAKLPQAGSPLLDIWFQNNEVGYAVGAYGMFLCTTDGGKLWKDCAPLIDNPDGWHLNAFIAADSGTFYIAGERGTLFRSEDSGASWQRLTSPYNGSYFGGLVGGTSSEVYLFGLQGNIYYSEDKGETFQKISIDSTDSVMAGILTPESLVFVGNSGLVITGKPNSTELSVEIMDDRKAILAVARAKSGKLVFVGQGGVRLFSAAIN